MRTLLCLIFVVSLSALAAQKKPQPKQTHILFVFDASRSMITKHQGSSRMEGAKELFFRFIDSLGRNRNMLFALRMYGHTVKYPPGNCKDSKLVVPFSKGNLELIKQKVREAKPTGITPIEHSLTEAASDFRDNKTENIVILITDGIEECGGDPCLARKKLLEKGIIFRPFIIGIGLSPEQIKTFECVGTFFDYDEPGVFSTITNIIQSQQLIKTSVQVNLLDQGNQPRETNVNTTFYDVGRKEYKYNYIHALNYRGNPDTLYVDEYPTYRVVAHTIPPAESQPVKLTTGKHNIIPIDAPQGILTIKRSEGVYNFNQKVKCMVRQGGAMNTLNVQPLNSSEKYLIGTYDLEILTLPRTYVPGNLIEQGKTVVVDIPSAGVVNIRCMEAGDGCILVKRGERLEWVANLGAQTQQSFYLQPGNYVAAWRSKSLKSSIYTVEKKFSVYSNQQSVVELFR